MMPLLIIYVKWGDSVFTDSRSRLVNKSTNRLVSGKGDPPVVMV